MKPGRTEVDPTLPFGPEFVTRAMSPQDSFFCKAAFGLQGTQKVQNVLLQIVRESIEISDDSIRFRRGELGVPSARMSLDGL